MWFYRDPFPQDNGFHPRSSTSTLRLPSTTHSYFFTDFWVYSYILLQSDKTLPPTEVTPDFKGNAQLARAEQVENQWFKIPKQDVIIGLDDPEDNSGGDNHFGW